VNPLFTVSFSCLRRPASVAAAVTFAVAAAADWVGDTTIRSASSRRLLCLWNCGNQSTDALAVAILVPITVTAAATRGSACGDFSGGDYCRCDLRPASILDLSSLFWLEHVWIFAFFLSPPWILPQLPTPPLLSLYQITILIMSMFICQLTN